MCSTIPRSSRTESTACWPKPCRSAREGPVAWHDQALPGLARRKCRRAVVRARPRCQAPVALELRVQRDRARDDDVGRVARLGARVLVDRAGVGHRGGVDRHPADHEVALDEDDAAVQTVSFAIRIPACPRSTRSARRSGRSRSRRTRAHRRAHRLRQGEDVVLGPAECVRIHLDRQPAVRTVEPLIGELGSLTVLRLKSPGYEFWSYGRQPTRRHELTAPRQVGHVRRQRIERALAGGQAARIADRRGRRRRSLRCRRTWPRTQAAKPL